MKLLVGTALATLLTISQAFAQTPVAPAAPASATAAVKPATTTAAKPDALKLTPEQKREIGAMKKEERKEWRKKYDAATPAQKTAIIAELDKKVDARKKEWLAKYDKASPEEKKRMEAQAARQKEGKGKKHAKKGKAHAKKDKKK